jgi:hypothetical protein
VSVSRSHVSVARDDGSVRIVVRPGTERLLPALALVVLALVWLWHLFRLFSFDTLDRKADTAAVVMWLLPMCALVGYNVWAFLVRQEIIADAKELVVTSRLGPWKISFSRISRSDIDTIEFDEVSKRVRGHMYKKRRVVVRGAGQVLAKTLQLDSSEVGHRVVKELLRQSN